MPPYSRWKDRAFIKTEMRPYCAGAFLFYGHESSLSCSFYYTSLYEGTIFYEQIEYEFEIDAQDGKIWSWEAESIWD